MKELNEWFLKGRRSFPWREEKSPYRVWISEVMLQQTRASVVIPYFERWIALFPEVRALAEAPLERVIKAWEGLGYYSRARNLHRGAREIVERFGGEIPATLEELRSIRGIGPYTAAAIASFGFHEKALPLDGNVMRVLSRYFCIEEEVGKSSVRKEMERLGASLLDEEAPWVSAEALIELGATVCQPKARCEACPLAPGCKAKREEKVEALPVKKGAPLTTSLERRVFVIESEGGLLLKKGEEGKVMEGLYEFPYFEGRARGPKSLQKEIEELLSLEVRFVSPLPPVQHTFTRFKASLYPALFQTSEAKEVEGYEWVEKKRLEEIPFSSGHRRVFAAWRGR